MSAIGKLNVSRVRPRVVYLVSYIYYIWIVPEMTGGNSRQTLLFFTL